MLLWLRQLGRRGAVTAEGSPTSESAATSWRQLVRRRRAKSQSRLADPTHWWRGCCHRGWCRCDWWLCIFTKQPSLSFLTRRAQQGWVGLRHALLLCAWKSFIHYNVVAKHSWTVVYLTDERRSKALFDLYAVWDPQFMSSTPLVGLTHLAWGQIITHTDAPAYHFCQHNTIFTLASKMHYL